MTMANNNLSRDEIASKVFGRKFSSLSLESKQWVNKTMSVMYSAGRQGHDTGYMLSTAAMNETAKIVKQLKEISINPGDVVELPKGVLADAARVIHYQSKAVGRGRVLDPKDFAQIKKDIKKQFGNVNPQIVAGITDYLTNTTGRFSGVGPKTLRGKLGSFLTKEELGTISNKEIVAARDIVIAHLFDKWSGGNLSSFVKPRLEDVLSSELKQMQAKAPSKMYDSVSKAELQKTVDALETLENLQKNPSKLNSPVVRTALSNLGLSPKNILGDATKTAVSEIQHAAYKEATKRAKGRTDIRLGGGLRRRPRLLTRASPEYLQSLPTSYPTSGIGKRAIIKSRWSGKEFQTDLPKILEDSGDASSRLTKLDGYLASEQFDFSNPSAEAEYGVNWTKKIKSGVDVGPREIIEHATGLIEPYVAAVTKAEARMGLQQHYHDMYLDDLEAFENIRDKYVDTYGNYYGKLFHENHVPFDVADKLMSIRDAGARKEKLAEVIDWYTSGLKRHDQPITVNPDEISPFSPSKSLAGFYGGMGWDSPVMAAVSRFTSKYPQGKSPADLPAEISRLVETGEGHRVGVVGSKSWDNEPFMREFFNKNWNAGDVMVTSSELGQSPADKNVKFGAAYQASNWAHHTQSFQHKLPVRVEWLKKNSGKQYQKDFTTSDVINNSDEVVAFFDEMYLSPSGREQMRKLSESIGDKPLRIVWVPSNTTKTEGSVHAGMHVMNLFGDKKNVKFDRYYPGALPAEVSDKGFKFLARGGSLKPGESAIIGEGTGRGGGPQPEMLVPDGHGGHHVIPNTAFRKLAIGSMSIDPTRVRDITNVPQPDEHRALDKFGNLVRSVTEITKMGVPYGGPQTSYYSDRGSVAHYHAGKILGDRYGVDTSHMQFPDVSPARDIKNRLFSKEEIEEQGRLIGLKFVETLDANLANQGKRFVPEVIERRFVNDAEGYAGSPDIVGRLEDIYTNKEVGKVLIDFKNKSANDFKAFGMQCAAYAGFFTDQLDAFVVRVTGDLDTAELNPIDLQKGQKDWLKALEWNRDNPINTKKVPASLQTPAMDYPAYKRWFTLGTTHTDIGDKSPTLLTLDPQHLSVAIGKLLPQYGSPDWDKNPTRLSYYEKRLDELMMSAAHDPTSVSVEMRKVLADVSDAGIDHDMLVTLLRSPKGSIPDNPQMIKFLRSQYDIVKKHVFASKAPDESDVDAYMRWEDSRTLANIIEEAGKAFASVPDFTKPAKSFIVPNTVPGPDLPGVSTVSPGEPQKGPNLFSPDANGWLIPWKDAAEGKLFSRDTPESAVHMENGKPTVNLCGGTLKAFEAMFRNSTAALISAFTSGGGKGTGGSTGGTGKGGSRTPDEDEFKKKYLSDLEHPTGWQRIKERLPVVGLPAQMKRKERQYGERVMEAEQSGDADLAPKGYWKLLEKEDQARKGYLRSIRGATTSFLIAQHVMRVFGQTSKVYNKAHESVSKGLGYVIDMFLLPVLPLVGPVVKGLVMIGNVIRSIPALGIVGGVVLAKLVYDSYTWIKTIGGLPAVITKASEALDKLVGVLERAFPIPEEIKDLHLNEERGLVPYTDTAEAYRGRMMDQSRMLPPGKTYGTDFYAPESGPASGRSGKYDIIPSVNWTFGGPGMRPAEKKRPIPKGFLGDIPYYNKGGIVSGIGNKDSVLAMLTPGEVVISKNDLPHYADGGVVGGVVGNILGMYSGVMSTDIAQSIVGGLGVVSKAVGAMMAPLAPALAIGALAGRGWQSVKNSIDRGTTITSTVAEGGFGALRTLLGGNLVVSIGIAASLIGIYNLLRGNQPIMPTGTMPRGFDIGDIGKGIRDRLGQIWEELKTRALDAWNKIKARALEIWDSIKSRALEIWERIKAPFERVKLLVEGIFEKFKTSLDRIKGVIDIVKTSFNNLAESIKPLREFIDRLFGKSPGADAALGGPKTKGGVWDSAKEFGSKLMKGGYLPTAGLVGLNEIFKGETDPIKILTSIAPAMAGQWVFNKAASKIAGFGGTAASVGGSLLGGAGGFLAHPFFKDLGANGENFFRRTLGMQESDNPWLSRLATSGVGSAIMGLPGVVGGGVEDWYHNIAGIFDRVGKGESAFITDTNQGVMGTMFKEMFNMYGNLITGDSTSGRSVVFDAIYNAGYEFKGVIDNFATTVTTAFDNIVKSLVAIPTTVTTGLSNLATDISNAIMNAVTGVGTNVINTGSGIVNGIAEKLPIPKFDTGGYVGKSGLAWVDKGETISPIGVSSSSLLASSNRDIVNALNTISNNMKQPTINYNTIEMANSDPYELFRMFQQWLAGMGNSSGIQRSI